MCKWDCTLFSCVMVYTNVGQVWSVFDAIWVSIMSTLKFMILIGFGYLMVFLFLIPFKVLYGPHEKVPQGKSHYAFAHIVYHNQCSLHLNWYLCIPDVELGPWLKGDQFRSDKKIIVFFADKAGTRVLCGSFTRISHCVGCNSWYWDSRRSAYRWIKPRVRAFKIWPSWIDQVSINQWRKICHGPVFISNYFLTLWYPGWVATL